jgi:hypothetical protein
MKIHLYVTAILVMALCVILVSFDTSSSVAKSDVSRGKRILGIDQHRLTRDDAEVADSARSNPDYRMMKEAGIGWVRLGFAFPFEDKMGGKLSDTYLKNLEEAKRIRRQGLRIMGRTPMAGAMSYNATDGQTVWRLQIPAWAGPYDSDSFYETYEKACGELARETRGIVDMWQVGNEMDIKPFIGPLSLQQVERFLLAGARGLKAVNPQLKVDINPAHFDTGEPLFRDLYAKPDTPFDYAGIDGYFGNSRAGGPQEWLAIIDRLYAITGKPVLVNEWGYSSIQGSGVPLDRNVGPFSVCQNQAWKFVWRKEHSPEEQAAYVEMGMKIFATYPHVAGAFFFEWSDNPVCMHCGTRGCPQECGWGLVDSKGKPKPAYNAFKAAAHEYW